MICWAAPEGFLWLIAEFRGPHLRDQCLDLGIWEELPLHLDAGNQARWRSRFICRIPFIPSIQAKCFIAWMEGMKGMKGIKKIEDLRTAGH